MNEWISKLAFKIWDSPKLLEKKLVDLTHHGYMCHFLAQGSHRGNFSCDESTKGSWCLQRKEIREYLKMHFVQGTHYLGPGIPVWVCVLLWHIYVLMGSDPAASPGCAAPSRKMGQFQPVEAFHLWNMTDSLSWIHFHSGPPGIPWQERLRPAGGADGTSPFWKDLENWGPEIKQKLNDERGHWIL